MNDHQQYLAAQDRLAEILVNAGFVVVDYHCHYNADGSLVSTPKRVATFARGNGRTLIETSVNFVDASGNIVVAEDLAVWQPHELMDHFWDACWEPASSTFKANEFKVDTLVFPGVRVVRCRRSAKTGSFHRSEGKPSKMYASPDLVRAKVGKTKELPERFDPWNKRMVPAENEFGEIWPAL